MLDLRLIRIQPDFVKQQLANLGVDPSMVDRILDADERRRTALKATEDAQARLKITSKEIGRRRGRGEDTSETEEEARALREVIREAETALGPIEAELLDLQLQVPNLPSPGVPVGVDETENEILRIEGEQRSFPFSPKPHWELGEALGIIDFDRGVKIAGSRFYVLKGDGARLQRALISWMLDLHRERHGYEEVYPPFMALPQCLVGTGQLPKFADTMYIDRMEDLYFIPTAEVPVTNMYRDEILPGSALPIKHVAYTACFRREAMSAGRDVRGIKRGHQFDKVELVKFTRPEHSDAELAGLLSDAEDVARGLGLSWRVVRMCTGDLSFSAAEKLDIELWAPGCAEWLEVSSCSNFKDFQARRAGIRFKDTGGKPEFVHTLNGSGLALPRTMIAVMENGQREDGSIVIPEVLRPYLGGQETISRQG